MGSVVHRGLDSAPQPGLVREKFLALMVIVHPLPRQGCRHFKPNAHPSSTTRYISEWGVVGDAEVTPAGWALRALCKAEFKPFFLPPD